MATKSGSLHSLLHKGAVWRGRQTADQPCHHSLSSGYPQLDALLPGQGWQASQLVELLYQEEGSGELGLVLPLLAELSQQERWVLWVDPPHIPYAPALLDAGVNLDRVQVVRSNSRRDRLWCLEQSMKSGCCSAVLGWLPAGQEKAIRRLQVAAAEGECRGFLFRHSRCREQHSAAPCRLLLEPHPEGVTVSTLKRRGGWPLPPRLVPVMPSALSKPQSDKNRRPQLTLVGGSDEHAYHPRH
ncbi:translesion DNA synthesis-associated protein ImuA [Pontibacterium granulatum]|uniref:translesion DNA synthesis-associated protein ImuA n=1 Tax=Pontibacterium granulatum TaxID=2036029 RepID=UPI00249C8FB2|nr:translesion DNA synthesis-associated protein ImuA [Pontibacterium granulatum]MDI3325255.1 translesion DNA synthesis-associated protein ImuA [Pontibacterium granulatum]